MVNMKERYDGGNVFEGKTAHRDEERGGGLYSYAPRRAGRQTPTVLLEEYFDFRRQVGMAILEINMNEEGKKIVAAFQAIQHPVEIVPTRGSGFFIPNCSEASHFEIPASRSEVCAVIAWSPTESFSHENTADGRPVTYPPWVVLAHEMGRAIQMHRSNLGPGNWYRGYIVNPAAVEMENITAHETPIVTTLGLAPRTSYPV